jgi:hypothetical protein
MGLNAGFPALGATLDVPGAERREFIFPPSEKNRTSMFRQSGKSFPFEQEDGFPPHGN